MWWFISGELIISWMFEVSKDWWNILLPVFYFRLAIGASTCESLQQRATHAVLLASLAVLLLGDGNASWENLVKLLSAELGSYIFGAKPSVFGAVISICAYGCGIGLYLWWYWLLTFYNPAFFIVWLLVSYFMFRFLRKLNGHNISQPLWWISWVLLVTVITLLVRWFLPVIIYYVLPLEEFGLA